MKNMKNKALAALLLMSAVGMADSVQASENDMQNFSLDPVVVTATRYEKKDVEVAAATEVFDEKRLKETGASNLYEALGHATGIELQDYGPGGSSMGNMASKVVIRGNNNGTLVLLNGIPLNIRGTYDLNDIPLENIERVEIVRGGGSVLYGSNATGGVINIITKKQTSNYIKAGIGNYGQQEYAAGVQAGDLSLNYKYSKWGVVNDISKDGKSWEGPENNNFSLNYRINDKLNLFALHNESDYNFISAGKRAKNTEQDVDRNNVQLRYNDDEFSAALYYLDRNRDSDEFKLSDNSLSSHEKEKNYNYGLDVQKNWDINDGKFIFGGSYMNENYKLEELDGAGTNGKQDRNNFSVYAQYDKKISDKDTVIISGRESWTTGAQYGLNDDNFSGQVQFVHSLGNDENIYASAGTSYKMPELHQIYKAKEGADLKPQTGKHYELGWKKDIDHNKSFRVALFSYKVEDNISATWNEKKDDFEYENENLKNTGIEASYTVSADKGFGYNLGIVYGNPKGEKIDDSGSSGWRRDYSRLQLKGGLTYRMDKFRGALNATYMADRATYYTGMGNVTSGHMVEAKPYLLTNLNMEYQFDKNISAYATINNLLDRKDISYVSDNPYYFTPFNFIMGVTCKF